MEQRISTSIVIANWAKIPDDQVNGRLLGYKLKYTITLIADKATVGAPVTKIIILDKYTFRHKIHGLQSYTTYDVSVAGYTAAGDGPYSTPVQSSKLNLISISVFHSSFIFFKYSNPVWQGKASSPLFPDLWV